MMTPDEVARLHRRILFDQFGRELVGGYLSRAGLLDLRWRLDDANGEFRPGADKDLLRLDAAKALAECLGCDVADLPDAVVAPDTPGDLPPPGDAPQW